MTNTERLIYSLDCAKKSGVNYLNFYVGSQTGNGPSVVAALRRRGFSVERIPASRGGYRLTSAQGEFAMTKNENRLQMTPGMLRVKLDGELCDIPVEKINRYVGRPCSITGGVEELLRQQAEWGTIFGAERRQPHDGGDEWFIVLSWNAPEKLLCRGFRASRLESETGEWLEMLYAVLPNGAVLKTDWGRTANDFGSSKLFQKTGLSLEDVRGGVEFIGNYPIPKAA